MIPSTEPLHARVANMVKSMIDEGVLIPGQKVPSLRKMSQQAKVSLTTTIQAYANLEDQGIIVSRPQSGYYVTPEARCVIDIPDRIKPVLKPRVAEGFNVWGSIYESATQPGIVPLGLASPSADLMPIKALNRAVRKVLTEQPEKTVEYSFPPGELSLRQQIANSYYRLNQSISPEDIIITNGATEGVMVALKAVAKAGAVVAVESPVYFVILRIIQSLGMTVLEIDSDPQTGLSVDSLEKALKSINVHAVVTVPNFGNPTGILMPDEKKQRLVNLLKKHEIPLIEDDIYGELFSGPTRPSNCREFSTDNRVITCSSFSKTIASGYRVGWVIPGVFRERIIRQKRLSSAATGTLPQLAIAEFIQSGGYDRHLRKLRMGYRDRLTKLRNTLAQHLPKGTRISDPKGGFVLWVQFPKGVDTLILADQTMRENISIAPGVMFSVSQKYGCFARFCAGHPWSDRTEKAIIRVGELATEMLKSPPESR